ncbi:DUF2177 family protein [Acidisoma cellulosilytica]|uniref:DUF2177 family protein n=1 Tax=Acidisoma cellulosilyticum TaxID=2802395 RepID=A0A964E323_9PROT|nr:DUF2177 family protein [Acidisoma cellulosilyticum]MCB8879827.1 DUF2177 family protein [Acidisoma cellulosilyticum]
MPVVAYLVSLLVFLALDVIWLGLMGPSYHAVMRDMLSPTIRFAPAIAFYLLDVLGLMIFVMLPGRARGALWVMAHAALFGLFTYGAYDLTNYAVLKHWDLTLTVKDMVWGMVVSAFAASIGWFVMRERGGGRRRR